MIPFCKPNITDNELNAVSEVMKKGWLANGPETAKFEEEFKEYIGCKYSVAVNNCTSALFLSLKAMDLKGEVITTPLTFASTGNVILHNGLKPVFVDIDDTFNIDPDEVEKAINDKTCAILPVHYAGLPCDMQVISKLAEDYDLALIEDAAHAVGSRYMKQKIGNIQFAFPDIHTTCFSFYATKVMTAGTGGMITTDDRDLYHKLRLLRNNGIEKEAWQRDTPFYIVSENGYNMYMSDINAAIGRIQLKKLDNFIADRKKTAEFYDKELKHIAKGQRIPKYAAHSHYIYPILLPDKIEQQKFIFEMKLRKIDCSCHFVPLHKQPAFLKYTKKLPIAEDIASRIVSLPLYPFMDQKDKEYIVKKVNEVLG